MLRRAVYAGQKEAFAPASESLRTIGDLDLSAKEVERICRRIGAERVAEREAEVEAWRRLPLAVKESSPRDQVPAIAAIGFDGGRYQQIPDGSDDERDRANGKRWRQFQAGCLLSLVGEEFAEDPCPDVPANLLDPARVAKLAKEIKSAGSGTRGGTFGDDAPDDADEPDPHALGDDEPFAPDDEPVDDEPIVPARRNRRRSSTRPGAPTALVRTVEASSADNHAFGEILAAAAWRRGMMAAPRKAFLGDGAAGNWTVWRRLFPTWTPILDFVHLITYVWTAALAGRSPTEGRRAYARWITYAWRGEVDALLAELRDRAGELGPPPPDAAATDPRKVVASAVTYVENNRERMDYAAYRRRGLPITTSRLESTVKQINQRIKGTEKHWSRTGGEALLQLRADHLGDTRLVEDFWERRRRNATGQRSYRRAT